jgi:hypothetical protein
MFGEIYYFVVRPIRLRAEMADFLRPTARWRIDWTDLRGKRIDLEQIREKKSAGSNSPVRRNVSNIHRVGLCAFYRYC